MTRDDWKRVEAVLNKPDVITAMKGRCEEEGHVYEMGLTVMFQPVSTCKWCGFERAGFHV